MDTETLELVILKTLAREGANHGFGIAQQIQKTSDGLLDVEEGSLYPALHRLEKKGLLKARWRVTDNGRRARVYTILPEGRKRLVEVEDRWLELAKGLYILLRPL